MTGQLLQQRESPREGLLLDPLPLAGGWSTAIGPLGPHDHPCSQHKALLPEEGAQGSFLERYKTSSPLYRKSMAPFSLKKKNPGVWINVTYST